MELIGRWAQAITQRGMQSGHFPVAVDDKGRLAIPIEIRRAAGGPHDDRLVITEFRVDGRPCLDAFFPAQWQRLLDKLATKNRFDPGVLRFQRAYVHVARECPLDPQGRVVVPSYLREHAGIRRDAVITADAHKFSIWTRDLWEQQHAEDQKVFDDVELLKELDL